VDINSWQKGAEENEDDSAILSLGFNPADLTVGTTRAKSARSRRREKISCIVADP
jgi:hypothetical protein